MHGYSKTDDRHVRDVFQHLDYNKCHSLLDIGCGKGVVLREATRFPFHQIAGFDIDVEMCRTAKRNFKILKMDNITIERANALKYTDYGRYDTFFIANPVNEELLKMILHRIILQKKSEILTFCYYHMQPSYRSIFIDTGRVMIVDKLFDRMKQYETYIMELR